jgi:transcriptional regulator
MKENPEERLITLRRAKVAELLAKGFSQVEIAKDCVTSEPTISRDVEFLRKEATARMEESVQDLPFQHAEAVKAVDTVLRYAFEVMDDKGSKDRLEAAKLILQASEIRLQFLGDVQLLDGTIKHIEAMKKSLEQLRKGKPAKYEVESTFEPSKEKGGKGNVTRRVVSKVVPIV